VPTPRPTPEQRHAHAISKGASIRRETKFCSCKWSTKKTYNYNNFESLGSQKVGHQSGHPTITWLEHLITQFWGWDHAHKVPPLLLKWTIVVLPCVYVGWGAQRVQFLKLPPYGFPILRTQALQISRPLHSGSRALWWSINIRSKY